MRGTLRKSSNRFDALGVLSSFTPKHRTYEGEFADMGELRIDIQPRRIGKGESLALKYLFSLPLLKNVDRPLDVLYFYVRKYPQAVDRDALSEETFRAFFIEALEFFRYEDPDSKSTSRKKTLYHYSEELGLLPSLFHSACLRELTGHRNRLRWILRMQEARRDHLSPYGFPVSHHRKLLQ